MLRAGRRLHRVATSCGKCDLKSQNVQLQNEINVQATKMRHELNTAQHNLIIAKDNLAKEKEHTSGLVFVVFVFGIYVGW